MSFCFIYTIAIITLDDFFLHRRNGLETPWDSKPSKIQTIFQLSVTALAFLAFAGYLLCMIVQAIKSKGNFLISLTDKLIMPNLKFPCRNNILSSNYNKQC